MAIVRRLGGALGLILSAVGMVCCLGGVASSCWLHRAASDRVQAVSERMDAGLQWASAANQKVRSAVAKARADMLAVRTEASGLGLGGEKGRRATRAVRTFLQQQLGPDIDALGGRLAMMSEAAAAAGALLEGLSELTGRQAGGIPPDRFEDWSDQAHQLSISLRRLEVMVGNADREASQQEVADESGRVERVLRKCQAATDNWQSTLEAARADVARIKAEALGWLTAGAAGLGLACAWLAAGQVSLLAHVWRWCRGLSTGTSSS